MLATVPGVYLLDVVLRDDFLKKTSKMVVLLRQAKINRELFFRRLS